MSKKIILVPSSTEPVGVSVHVLNLAKLLDRDKIPVSVFCPNSGWLTKQLKSEGIDYTIFNAQPTFGGLFSSNISLFTLLTHTDGNVLVHLHGRFPLFSSLLSMVLLPDIDFYLTVHQFSEAGNSGIFNEKYYLESFIWKHGIKGISCVSEPLQTEVVNRIGQKKKQKVSVIHNWIEPLNYGQSGKLESSTNDLFQIVGVGRLSYDKGFDLLIEALHSIDNERENISCDIYGAGPEEERLLQTISKLGLEPIVELKGTHPEVRTILPKYDALVIPSRTESFGLVALEAYDAGIPVIASNIPGLNEIVRDTETGLLFESENPKDLASNINMLINSQKLANNLTTESSEFVKRYYPNKRVLNEFIDFYHE